LCDPAFAKHPNARQFAENLPDDGLLLYGTLYTMSSAFLHGQGGELPYLVGLTGDKGLPIDPLPSQVGFEMSLLSIHETFRVAISRAAAVLAWTRAIRPCQQSLIGGGRRP